jgi:hypothetical protein
VIEILLLIITILAAICYIVAYAVLSILFTLWGLILYAIGPLLVATIPSEFFGGMGKTYIKGLIQWLAWPVLFAVLSELMSLLQADQSTSNIWQNAPWVISSSSSINSSILIGITTIVFSLMLLSMPWIAHKILSGDFAGSMGASWSSMVTAAVAVGTAGAGAAVGAAAGGAGMLSMAGGSSAASSGGAAGAASGATGSGTGAAGAGSGGGSSAGGTVAPPPNTPSGPSSSGSGSGAGHGGGGSGVSVSSPTSSGGSGTDDGGGSSGGGWKDVVAGAVMGAMGGPQAVASAAARAHFRNAGRESKAGPPPPSEEESYQMSFGDAPSEYID